MGEPEEVEPQKSDSEQQKTTVIDFRRTAAGGLVAAIVAAAFTMGVGTVAPYEAPKLLEPFIATLQFFCGAMCTASGTIVALMLTALGLSAQAERRFNEFHYRRLRFIARMATIVFVLSTLLLLLIGVPLERADHIPRQFHNVVYYVVTTYAAVLCGLVVTTVLMLYRTVSETIEAIGLAGDDHYLIRTDDD